MTFARLLADVVARLDAARIPYMITGSLAGSWYGEPRTTQDLDVVIDPSPPGLDRLIEGLQMDRWYVDHDVALGALRERTQFNAIGPDGFKIDFIVRHDRPFSIAEFERRRPGEMLGTQTFVASPEDMVIAKLDWARATDSERQLRDVDAMLDVSGGQLDRAYIEGWVQRLGLEGIWRRVGGRAGPIDVSGSDQDRNNERG